ncbi:MAG: helix-turn-helix transcriptional regulator [Clostridia bacterium]|nr:helix-turn-helix transcriptional regulator [Clostridia bacterium]
MKTLNDVVVERLCKYLGEKNITQYKLSQLSGVPFPTIKSIMQRRTKGIALKTIIMLAYGLDITPSEFINDEMFLADNLDLE